MAPAFPLDPHCSMRDPATVCIPMTWELVGKADPQTHPRLTNESLHFIEIPGHLLSTSSSSPSAQTSGNPFTSHSLSTLWSVQVSHSLSTFPVTLKTTHMTLNRSLLFPEQNNYFHTSLLLFYYSLCLEGHSKPLLVALSLTLSTPPVQTPPPGHQHFGERDLFFPR